MKSFGVLNIILSIILCLFLASLGFFSIVHNNFADTSSVLGFLEKGKVYDNLSTAVKLEIQSKYPENIRKNIIYYALANKIMEAVVTPETVAVLARPAVELSYAYAKTPTAIISNKVAISTAIYKDQVKEMIAGFELPKIVNTNVDMMIDSVPATLTLVDLEKHPNSILGLIIKWRALYRENEAALKISYAVIFAVIVISLISNMFSIRKFFGVLWSGFISAGVVVILATLIGVWIMNMAFSGAVDSMVMAQNKLIADAVSYFMSQLRNCGIVLVLIGLACFVFWRLFKFEKIQGRINKSLHHVHVPSVSVKIK